MGKTKCAARDHALVHRRARWDGPGLRRWTEMDVTRNVGNVDLPLMADGRRANRIPVLVLRDVPRSLQEDWFTVYPLAGPLIALEPGYTAGCACGSGKGLPAVAAARARGMPVHRWDLGVAEGGPREGVHVRSEEHA